ncbi:unnamed protein product [Victoria cruziana]
MGRRIRYSRLGEREEGSSSLAQESGEYTGFLEEPPSTNFSLFKSGEHTCKVFSSKRRRKQPWISSPSTVEISSMHSPLKEAK